MAARGAKKMRPAERPNRLAVGDSRHGTMTGYYYWSCRCDLCKDFAREAAQRRKDHRQDNLHLEVHGRASTYTNAGCRCEPCKAANKTAEEARELIRSGPKVELSDLR